LVCTSAPKQVEKAKPTGDTVPQTQVIAFSIAQECMRNCTALREVTAALKVLEDNAATPGMKALRQAALVDVQRSGEG
jgi:hypothetical protein